MKPMLHGLLPRVLQTIVIRDSTIRLSNKGIDLLDRFYFAKGLEPDYIKTIHGGETDAGCMFDVAKIVSDDFSVVDSSVEGAWVAGLLAGGVRRLLQGGFDDEAKIAQSIGLTMIRREKYDPPIRLIAFIDSVRPSGRLIDLLKEIDKHTRPVLCTPENPWANAKRSPERQYNVVGK